MLEECKEIIKSEENEIPFDLEFSRIKIEILLSVLKARTHRFDEALSQTEAIEQILFKALEKE